MTKSNFDRRQLLGGTAVAAASLAIPAAPQASVPSLPHTLPAEALRRRVLKNHVMHAGKYHKVNASWHWNHTAPWPHLAALSHEELWVEAHRLMRLADQQGALKAADRAYLTSVNTHINVRRGIILLKGRDIADFKFTGHDQVCHNATHLPCGCKPMHVFDGEKIRAKFRKLHAEMVDRGKGIITREEFVQLQAEAAKKANVAHHLTHALALCGRHEHLEGTTDYAALHRHLWAENGWA